MVLLFYAIFTARKQSFLAFLFAIAEKGTKTSSAAKLLEDPLAALSAGRKNSLFELKQLPSFSSPKPERVPQLRS